MPNHHDDIHQSHYDLITAISACKPHRIIGNADAGDLADRIDHMRDIARIVDTYFLAIGADCKQHATTSFDMGQFTNITLNAIETATT